MREQNPQQLQEVQKEKEQEHWNQQEQEHKQMIQQQEQEQIQQQKQQHEWEQQQIRDKWLKVTDTQKSNGKQKQVPRHHSNSDRKRQKTCQHGDLFGLSMIAD